MYLVRISDELLASLCFQSQSTQHAKLNIITNDDVTDTFVYARTFVDYLLDRVRTRSI